MLSSLTRYTRPPTKAGLLLSALLGLMSTTSCGENLWGGSGWATESPLPCNNHYNNSNNVCQPRLSACGASLSSPGRLVLNDLIRAGNRQMVNVRQDQGCPVQCDLSYPIVALLGQSILFSSMSNTANAVPQQLDDADCRQPQ